MRHEQADRQRLRVEGMAEMLRMDARRGQSAGDAIYQESNRRRESSQAMIEQNKAEPTDAQMRAIRAAEALTVVYNAMIEWSQAMKINRQAESIVAQAQTMQKLARNVMGLYKDPGHIQSEIMLILSDCDVQSTIVEIDPNAPSIVH